MADNPMTHPSPEAVERALTYFAGKPKSFTGMLATLHGKTLARATLAQPAADGGK